MSNPWTVGALREAMARCADDEQVVVTVSGSDDLAVETAFGSYLIPWEHDCANAPEGHRPGRDCPTGPALQIRAQRIDGFGKEVAA